MANNIDIKDAAGATRTMKTTDNSGIHTPAHTIDGTVTVAGVVAISNPVDDDQLDKVLIGTSRTPFSDNFLNFDTTNNWEVIQTGSGMAITVAGTGAGSRYLNIASGVTPNSETIILSRKSFRIPAKLLVPFSMSHRIANTEVFIELVSVNIGGSVETDTAIPSPETNNALNCAAWKYDGTSASSARNVVRARGATEFLSALIGALSSAATGTSPNFLPAFISNIGVDTEEINFVSGNANTLGTSFSENKYNTYFLDGSKLYKIRIRVKNLATAPASSTDVRIHGVRASSNTALMIDISKYNNRGTD